MARPRKTGLDYFPFDVDFFSNKKIKILKARYGTDGVIVFIFLLCEIYRNGYYLVWDDDYKYIVADELNLSDGLIEQVLKFLVERSLLCSILLDSDTILTSPGIQNRFQEAVKSRASKSPISVIKELWLLTKEKTQGFIKVSQKQSFSENNVSFSEKKQNNSENNDIKESKVKKSKVNESKVVLQIPASDGIYCVYEEFYNQLATTYTQTDITKSLNSLRIYLEANPEKRRKIKNTGGYVEMWVNGDTEKGKCRKVITDDYEPTYDLGAYENTSIFDE